MTSRYLLPLNNLDFLFSLAHHVLFQSNVVRSVCFSQIIFRLRKGAQQGMLGNNGAMAVASSDVGKKLSRLKTEELNVKNRKCLLLEQVVPEGSQVRLNPHKVFMRLISEPKVHVSFILSVFKLQLLSDRRMKNTDPNITVKKLKLKT